jgi:hypothetical protein
MKKISGLTISILLVSFLFGRSVSAQLKDNFLKGSIGLQNGEIINGFIQDDEIKVMSHTISFKTRKQKRRFQYIILRQ